MYRIHYLNPISEKGRCLWDDKYCATENLNEAQAVIVRSAAMHDLQLPEGLLAVARGAGVNNIPLDRCAEQGIVVFNTPGANANGVTELALCGMLLASRDVIGGVEWVKTIAEDPDIAKKVEKGKSKFAGCEIAKRTMGVIGLGAVGGPLANAASRLGMHVYGCDPFISVDAAWNLDREIVRVKTRDEIYEQCDIISLHTPLLDDTRKMINKESLAKMKDGVIILNFARDLLVDDDAMEEALKSGKVKRYVTDFPNNRTASMDGVIAIPHLGASTEEAEDNCAIMAVKQMMNYLENGNIVNSVNYPNCDMGVRTKVCRICILHKNAPNALNQFTTILAEAGLAVSDMLNRSRGEYACTMFDLETVVSESVASALQSTAGVCRVRVIS